jgi:hypothetical protein
LGRDWEFFLIGKDNVDFTPGVFDISAQPISLHDAGIDIACSRSGCERRGTFCGRSGLVVVVAGDRRVELYSISGKVKGKEEKGGCYRRYYN